MPIFSRVVYTGDFRHVSLLGALHPVFFTHRNAKISNLRLLNSVGNSQSLCCLPCQWHLMQWIIHSFLPYLVPRTSYSCGCPSSLSDFQHLHLLTVETSGLSPWLFFLLCPHSCLWGSHAGSWLYFKYHPYANDSSAQAALLNS